MALSLSLALGVADVHSGGGGFVDPASLSLDFVRGLYKIPGVPATGAIASLPGWAFTNASGGYGTWANGAMTLFAPNVPRITDLGIWAEEPRTNLQVRSQEFGNVAWTKQIGGVVTVTDNAAIAPDGTMTASLLSSDGTNTGFIYGTSPVASSTTYTFSVFAKLGTMPAANYLMAFYDNTNGAFIAQNVAPTQAITADGWTRAIYTVTTPATCTGLRVYPWRSSGTGASATGSLYLWGAQLELGAFATSYIPTTAAAAARSADLAAISGLVIPSAVTMGGQGVAAGLNAINANYMATLSDGTVNNLMQISVATTTGAANALVGGLAQAASGATVNPSIGVPVGVAARFQANIVKAAANGVLGNAPANTFAMPALTQLNIGNRTDGLRPFNGPVSQVRLYPYAANDAELQQRSAGGW